MSDDWDPRILFPDDPPEPRRIYGDDKGDLFATVDWIDYQFLLQWLWSPKWSRGGRKVYLRRVVQSGPRSARTQTTIFLHHAVMERAGIIKPSESHVLDHRDGDSLNCQRSNLRWLTLSQNRANLFGSHQHHEFGTD